MDHFPALLEHGPLIWKLILATTALLALATVVGLRYLLARNAGNNAGRDIRDDSRAVRGVLRGGTGSLASTLTIEAYNISTATPTTSTASWRAAKIELETADRKITLGGPLRVIAGARFVGTRRKLPALSPDGTAAVREQLPWLKAYVRSSLLQTLEAGDEIVIRGIPQPHAGQGETMGRDADIAWTLQGTDEEPLELVVTTPQAPRLPLGIGRAVIVLAIALGAGVAAKSMLGDHWVKECAAYVSSVDPSLRTANTPVELTNDHPCVLAASVESDREDALWRVRDLLERNYYRDAQTDARLTALARATKTCTQRVQSLYYNGRFEATLEEARLCNDPQYEHEALVALGRIDEALAVQLPVTTDLPKLPATQTLIAGKRWAEAASRLDVMASQAEHHSHELQYQCIAELFRHHAGDRRALERLHALMADEEGANQCTPILAEIDPATRQQLATTSRLHSVGDPAEFFEMAPSSVFEDLLIHPERNPRTAALLWLPFEATSKGSRIVRLRQQAAASVFDNDPVAARKFADEAVAVLASMTDEERRYENMYRFQDLHVLPRAVALYTGEVFASDPPEEPSEMLMYRYKRLYLRSSLSLERVKIDHDERTHNAFAEAKRTGNGLQLLSHLRPLGVHWSDGDLLAVLPHIKTDRDSIARELPYFPPPGGLGSALFDHAVRAMMRRELFEALGASADAAAWDAVYRRFDKIFDDRDVVVGLMLVH